MSRDLTQLNKLEEYLKRNGIRYRRIDVLDPCFDRHQIVVGGDLEPGACDWDAICHRGSYGCEDGLLEIMGSIVDEKRVGDCVEGYLMAADVIKRIEEVN
jgi:hypothetical protein